MSMNSREDILLKERIAQVDDINLDKLLDNEEVAEKELESFDEELVHIGNITNINSEEHLESEPAFEIEVQPNEFLDNIAFKEEEVKQTKKDSRLNITNKPLFYCLASIIALLGILFIYNLFVIGSLETKTVAALPSATSSYSEVYTENNYIQFDNGSTLEITVHSNIQSQDLSQTNWFDSVIGSLNQMFGGKN